MKDRCRDQRNIILETLNNNFVEVALLNSYFDFDDYETPIKTYLEDANIIFISTDFNTVSNYE